jgi:hypothetical protein
VVCCARGISDGALLPGTKFIGNRAETHSILLHARSRTVRHIHAIDDLDHTGTRVGVSGPEQVGQIDLRPAVDSTKARNFGRLELRNAGDLDSLSTCQKAVRDIVQVNAARTFRSCWQTGRQRQGPRRRDGLPARIP